MWQENYMALPGSVCLSYQNYKIVNHLEFLELGEVKCVWFPGVCRNDFLSSSSLFPSAVIIFSVEQNCMNVIKNGGILINVSDK